MNGSLIHLAGAIARPRHKRDRCDGSGKAVMAGCVHADGAVACPYCRAEVAAEPWLPHTVLVGSHVPGVTRG